MSDFSVKNLNKIQSSILTLIENSIEYSKNIRNIVAPQGFSDSRGIRDFCRIGVTLPQRSGVSVMSQFLSEYLSEQYPDANIIRMGSSELIYGDAIDPRIDFICVNTPADYGRARQKIRDSEKHYDFVILDQADWVCGMDNRLEKLTDDMYREGVSDQFLIALST